MGAIVGALAVIVAGVALVVRRMRRGGEPPESVKGSRRVRR
jgi:hypothetical protein